MRLVQGEVTTMGAHPFMRGASQQAVEPKHVQYRIDGLKEPPVRVQVFVAGTRRIGPDSMLLHVFGTEKNPNPPAPPALETEADVYRWIASLSEQGFDVRTAE